MVSPPPPAESNYVEIIHYPSFSSDNKGGNKDNYSHSIYPSPYGKKKNEHYQMSHSYSGYIPNNPIIHPVKQDRSHSVINSNEFSGIYIHQNIKVNSIINAADILEKKINDKSNDIMTIHDNKSPRTIYAGKHIPHTMISPNKISLIDEIKPINKIPHSGNIIIYNEDNGKETDILDSESEEDDDIIHVYSGDKKFDESSDDSDEYEEELSPEYKDLMEREEIKIKYFGNPEGKADDWENPDFNLYKMTDRYGFVHKDLDKIDTEDTIHEKQLELKREYKWLKMLKIKGKNHKKWEERIWKGVPDKMRPIVWPILLECQELKEKYPKNYYKELLEKSLLLCKDIKQIDLDINRTYRDHLAFRKRYDLKQKSLFNLLTACAMFNTEVGYCQGMSQIGALFLMYMDEEDSFWCMHSLLTNKKWGMHGFFKIGFPSLMRYEKHFNYIVEKYLPKLNKHLQNQDIPSIYLTKWWFGCFLDRVPFPLALRFWDVFLLNGSCMLIVIGYTILHLHQKQLRKCSIEGYLHYIQDKLANDFGYTMYDTMLNLERNYKKLKNNNDHLPPPPGENDPIEVPQQSFGVIMNRSLDEIKSEIDEIRSIRKSRCNSTTGKSPGINKKKLPNNLKDEINEKNKYNFKTTNYINKESYTNSSDKYNTTYSPSSMTKFPRDTIDNKNIITSTSPSFQFSKTSLTSYTNPSDPYYHSQPDPKIQLTKYGKTHPESPLVGRWTPTINKNSSSYPLNGSNRHSFYDNVEELANETRVIKLPNNVTCIEMDDDISSSRQSSIGYSNNQQNKLYKNNIESSGIKHFTNTSKPYQQQYQHSNIQYPKNPTNDYRMMDDVKYIQKRGNGMVYSKNSLKTANITERQSFI
ncbi:USP6 N-terminal-like protein [Strongyloides ratti]|uniref:USP6 N-terminal-like protein n=1 Tax=Strongyloides ratti TaxID=34506 RepID=A0A090LNN4_STRRB|nr:USP6 N-terminal-like protein [Strongyloides ratti]CEF71366.1 USP6 N-terminal-like protein [Strongyloides ratti]